MTREWPNKINRSRSIGGSEMHSSYSTCSIKLGLLAITFFAGIAQAASLTCTSEPLDDYGSARILRYNERANQVSIFMTNGDDGSTFNEFSASDISITSDANRLSLTAINDKKTVEYSLEMNKSTKDEYNSLVTETSKSDKPSLKYKCQ